MKIIKKENPFFHYFLPSRDFNIKKEDLFFFKFEFCNFLFHLYTLKNIFSSKKVDSGTKTLLLNLEFPTKGLVLDLGCGSGIIGLVIFNFSFNNVFFSDINYRAVYCAKKNWENNKYYVKNVKQQAFFLVGNGLKIFKENIFDAIYFYPPEKLGKEKIKKLVKTIDKHLKENGFLLFVITKKMKWLISFLEKKGNFEIKIVDKRGHYVIFKAILKNKDKEEVELNC